MTQANNTLIIFVKNPIEGRVKTRLAVDIGDDKALDVYKKLLEHTRDVALKANCSRFLFYSDFIDDEDEWAAEDFNKKLQVKGDLGEKMQAAFNEVLSEGFEKIVIIGSDCLQLTKQHLDRAFELLEQNSLVLGPSEDGGYYLLGLSVSKPKNLHKLFQNKKWSTSEVLHQTIQTAESLGFSYSLIETLNDIDTIEDWRSQSDLLDSNHF